ncbi:hypothetical protein H072_6933 [Dactylellina haptotyla CBS 200.50]|uniref:Thioesterase domain-containing protein n=1 Tax=Dactylellina haptotyla (strain CBS 200.50) TaxID=1284197 RepID=S8BJ05_DACHA|nr:hypothetical protein H072_6933 [Dactylellina haptotyla CBS 200.50]
MSANEHSQTSFFERNPSVIQPYGNGIPLVLIHDGGGTTYSYYGLRNLDRPVYGIHNPRFYTCRPFKGGIMEMARIYTQLIELAGIDGPFIIGGWSLGGLIALEITRILGTYPYGPIAGTVMIDTPCPVPSSVPASEPQLRFHENCRLEIKKLVQQNMKVAVGMLDRYQPPLNVSDWSYEDEQDYTLLDSASDTRFLPHVVLLKAQGYAPTLNQTEASSSIVNSARVDYFRDFTALGWEKAEEPLVSEVLLIPGNHYDLFMDENVKSSSNAIRKACDNLEADLYETRHNNSDSD